MSMKREKLYSFRPLFESQGPSNYRIPSVVVTARGTIIAFCNDRRNDIDDRSPEHWLCCRRCEEGGEFEPVQKIYGMTDWSCMIGAAYYDAQVDKVMCLFSRRPNSPAALAAHEATPEAERTPTGFCIAESTDDGRTFTVREVEVRPNSDGYQGSPHGSAAGIQLQHGPHAGRLISAARYTRPTTGGLDTEALSHLQTAHWNCSLYSDDHGQTWQTGGRVQTGTGEGTLMELNDGTVVLNSRAYFYDGYRRVAWSQDSGETFGRFQLANDLTEIVGGVNASMITATLPDESEICVYASVNNRRQQLIDQDFTWQGPRRNVSTWISFDGAQTWPKVRTIYAGPSAYNSLVYDAPRDRFIMLLEYGHEGETCYERGIGLATFNMAWLLDDAD